MQEQTTTSGGDGGTVVGSADVCEVDVPIFIELKNSSYGSGDLGAYCTMPLNADQFLGSYKGKTKKSMAQCADPEYVWTILSSRQMPLFYIDATDARDSNWLRFIRSTSDASKYNVICMQQNQQINYFTFRDIKVGEELVTFLAGKKKKRPKGHQTKTYKLYEPHSAQNIRSTPVASQNGPKILGNGAKAVTPRRNEDSVAPNNSGMLTRSTRLYRRNEDFMSRNNESKSKGGFSQGKGKAKGDEKFKIETKRLIINISSNQTDHFKMNSFSLKPFSATVDAANGAADEPNSSIYCLLKCDMCPFSCVALEASLDAMTKLNAQLKRHILVEHINQELFNDHKRDEAELVTVQVLNCLLNRIETDYSSGQATTAASDTCTSTTATATTKSLPSTHAYQFQFYQCNKCQQHKVSRLFKAKNDLVRHLISRHSVNANTLKCPKCDKCFDKTRTYDCLKHLATKHEDEWLKDTIPVSITSDHDFVESNRMNWTDYFGESVSDSVFSLESLVNGAGEEANNGDDLDDASSQTSSTASSSGTASSSSNKKRNGGTKGGGKKRKAGDQEENGGENEEENNENEEDEDDDDENGGAKKPGAKGGSDANGDPAASQSTKTWTCQLCKKQFDQRIDLSKHQCIELHLKQLKKKKEIRKKKWREAHWKRKIDLSYIETTSLTQFSQIIADNLSFCIDGTSEDLRAYTREVKDYLNTELGDETQMQMLMKYCFPELNDRVIPPPPPSQSSAPNQNSQRALSNYQNSLAKFVDTNVVRRANSYFIDCVHTASNDVHSLPPAITAANQQKVPGNRGASHNTNTSNLVNLTALSMFQCKSCRVKCKKLSDLITHQRQVHGMQIKTTFDCYNPKSESAATATTAAVAKSSDAENSLPADKSTPDDEDVEKSESLNWLSSNTNAISPVGYLGCDPFAYVLNLHWDQTIQKRCEHCSGVFNRQKYRKHVLSCPATAHKTEEPPATAQADESEPASLAPLINEESTGEEDHVDVEMLDQSQTEEVVKQPEETMTTVVQDVEVDDDQAVREVCLVLMTDLLDRVVDTADKMTDVGDVGQARQEAAVDEEASVTQDLTESEPLTMMDSLTATTATEIGVASEITESINEVTKSVSSPETDTVSSKRSRRKRSAVDDLNGSENLILNKKRQVNNARSSYDSENFVYFHQTKTSPTTSSGQQAKTVSPPPTTTQGNAAAPSPQGRSLRGSSNRATPAQAQAPPNTASPTRQSPRAAKPIAAPTTQVHSSSPLSSKTTRSVQARQLVLTPKTASPGSTQSTPSARPSPLVKSQPAAEAVVQEAIKTEENSEGESLSKASASQNQLRVSARIRRKPQEFSELAKANEPKFRRCVTSPSGSATSVKTEGAAPTTPVTASAASHQDAGKKEISPTLAAINNKLVRIELIEGDRKIYVCAKCGLEFTSPNSVIRHQEKSCLRVCVINLKLAANHQHTRMCPICSCVFNNTHRLSVHIYKYHRSLLGSATTPPSGEAKRLHEIQLKKSKTIACDQVIVEENESENMDETPFNSTKDIDSLLNVSNREVKDESKNASELQNTQADLDATMEDADSIIADVKELPAEPAESTRAQETVEQTPSKNEPEPEPTTPRLRKRPAATASSEEKKRPSNDGAAPPVAMATIHYKGAITRKKSDSLSSSSSASNLNQAAAAPEEPSTTVTAAVIANRAVRTSGRLSTDSNKNAKLNSTF